LSFDFNTLVDKWYSGITNNSIKHSLVDLGDYQLRFSSNPNHCDLHRHCCSPEDLGLGLCLDLRPVEKIVQLHRGSGSRQDKGYLGSRGPATAICICSESKHWDVERLQDRTLLHLIIACDLMHVKQVNTQVPAPDANASAFATLISFGANGMDIDRVIFE